VSDDSDRRGRLVSVLKRVAATVAVVAMLAWVLWGAWGDARQIDWSGLRLRPGLLVLSCVLLGLGFVWHGLVWVLMMRMLGYTLAVRPGLRASALSQLGNYIPGKVFIVLFRVQVAARYGVPGVPIAGSIALETLLRNLMATMLGTLGLYRLGEGESWLWGLGALIVLSLVFAHPRVFNAIARWVLRKLGRPPLPRELTGPQVLALLGCYLVYWVFYIAGFFLAVEGALGLNPSDLVGLATSAFMAQISSTLAVFAPIGLGASELTMAEVLRQGGVAAAPYMVAVIARVWRTLGEMAQIGLVLLIPMPAPAPSPAGEDGADTVDAEPAR